MNDNSFYGPLPDPAGNAGYSDHPPRVGFFTDTSICIGCKACEVACKEWNQVPDDGFNLLGMSFDNTGMLGANTWRHVAFIEQQEKRAVTTDTVARVVAVEPRLGHATLVQLLDPVGGALAQLVERTELDGVGRARLRARRFQAVAQPVVAQRALPCAPVALAPVDHPVGTARHAIAAAVANVLLHNDGTELGAEQGTGRAHVQATRMGAVLAHVGAH